MKSRCDIVYFVKESETNDELKYSLRTLDNWPHRYVWFCGGCPADLRPDKRLKIPQKGFNKWEIVRKNIRLALENEEISENFWLFNDDFFILKPFTTDAPQYDGELIDYIEAIIKKNNGSESQYTLRLRGTIEALEKVGCTMLNYEVHKPMLINKQMGLEILNRFPNVPGFRSLYGNYYQIGGIDRRDMKIRPLIYNMEAVDNNWDFLSTSDDSFKNGEVGRYIRDKFKERSRFEI